jgi:hypothetical protein
MAKKLEGNGMCSSSRIILREEVLKQYSGLKKLIKPDLDNQEVAAIDQAIHTALKTNGTIILTIYSKYKLKTVTGTVLKLDVIFQMVKIILDDPFAEHDECEWIAMRDILKVEVKEVEVWDDGDIDW